MILLLKTANLQGGRTSILGLLSLLAEKNSLRIPSLVITAKNIYYANN